MRVLHVVPGLAARTGGVASALVELCLGLEQVGVDATIFSTDLGETAAARTHTRVSPAGLPPGAEQLDVRLFRARPPYRLAFSPALRRALDRHAGAYDVVHIHSLWLDPQWAAYRAARRHDVPYVVCPQGMLDPVLRTRGRLRKAMTNAIWQRRMLERAAAIHFTAREEARLAGDVAPRVLRAIVANPIDWEGYQELPAAGVFRTRFLGGHDGPLVMNIGRIARKKGLDVLIRAFARTQAEFPNARLAIVGPDDEGLRPELEAVAAREGVAEATVFTGMLRGPDKLAALAAADVWALPSHQDAWASAVTEALAAGRPIVVSPAVNSAPEIEAANAGLVRPPEAEAFAGAIAGLLRDGEARRALGARGREFARRYGRLAVAQDAAEMYELAIAGAREPAATPLASLGVSHDA